MKNQSKFAQFRNELEALNKEEMKVVSGGYGTWTDSAPNSGGGGSSFFASNAWGSGGAGNTTPGVRSSNNSSPAVELYVTGINWSRVATDTNEGIVNGGISGGTGGWRGVVTGGAIGGVAAFGTSIYNQVQVKIY